MMFYVGCDLHDIVLCCCEIYEGCPRGDAPSPLHLPLLTCLSSSDGQASATRASASRARDATGKTKKSGTLLARCSTASACNCSAGCELIACAAIVAAVASYPVGDWQRHGGGNKRAVTLATRMLLHPRGGDALA